MKRPLGIANRERRKAGSYCDAGRIFPVGFGQDDEGVAILRQLPDGSVGVGRDQIRNFGDAEKPILVTDEKDVRCVIVSASGQLLAHTACGSVRPGRGNRPHDVPRDALRMHPISGRSRGCRAGFSHSGPSRNPGNAEFSASRTPARHRRPPGARRDERRRPAAPRVLPAAGCG